MDNRLEQFRTEAAKLGSVRRGRKFSTEMIALGAVYATGRRAQDASWQAIAQELDVAVPTVQRWAESSTADSPVFHRVSVVEPAAAERYAAVLPGGLRIEGLSLEAVVSLARSLS